MEEDHATPTVSEPGLLPSVRPPHTQKLAARTARTGATEGGALTLTVEAGPHAKLHTAAQLPDLRAVQIVGCYRTPKRSRRASSCVEPSSDHLPGPLELQFVHTGGTEASLEQLRREHPHALAKFLLSRMVVRAASPAAPPVACEGRDPRPAALQSQAPLVGDDEQQDPIALG